MSDEPLQTRREPIFNIPTVVAGLIAAFVTVHVARSFLPETAGEWWTLVLALIPARYVGYADELPGGRVAAVTSLVTHMFVHGDWLHLTVNSGAMLAFGGAVANRTGAAVFLVFSLLCGLAGAGAFLLLAPSLLDPMIGASGAISGLCAATFRFLFSAIDRGGLWYLREDPGGVPLMGLATSLSDRRVLSVAAIWIVINLLTIVGIGNFSEAGGIAWQAHIGGFVAGFLLFGLFDPVARKNSFRTAARHDQE